MTDAKQLLEDAISELYRIEDGVEGELSKELSEIIDTLRKVQKSVEYTSSASYIEEEVEEVADKLHTSLVEYDNTWEKNEQKRDVVDSEVIPKVESVARDITTGEYEEHKETLNDQFSGIDVTDIDDRL